MSKRKRPVLHSDAKIVLAGEVLELFKDKVEPDDANLLFNFLTITGNIFGNKAYMMAGGAKHYPRHFTAITGTSSEGSKGTGTAYIMDLIFQAFPEYVLQNVTSGATSGEGIIKGVEDRRVKEYEDKDGETKEKVLSEGVEDKRRLYKESEFARVLGVMNWESNTLSAILRQCWETGNLRVSTKESYYATNAHISILGHITPEELHSTLGDKEKTNGFVNRFMWVYVKRNKPMSFDKPRDEVKQKEIVDNLVQCASSIMPVEHTFTDDAKELYTEFYNEPNNHSGLIGGALKRRNPVVLRLALTYYLLDPLKNKRQQIEKKHLKAAIACYRYLEDSAPLIFRNTFKDKDLNRLSLELEVKNVLTKTDIHNLFGRHKSAGELRAICNTAIALDIAEWKESQDDAFGNVEMVFVKKGHNIND